MSQHDMDLANAAGASFRADANLALVALASNSSGATAPATTFAYQFWADTTTGLLKIRNAANSAWLIVCDMATGAPVLGAGATLTFEGATDNAFETTLTVADPTADNVVTLPDKSGTVAMTSDTAQIQPISASVGASALTISASALSLNFRSATLSSGTVTTVSGTPANLVISSGSTLGTVSATQSRIAVLAMNNAGTIELAAVNISGGNDLSETGLISTTAEGGAGAADAANVIYSTTARSNLAYRVIGYIESTQATAGTWATAPSTIQGAGGNAVTAMSSLGYGQTWSSVIGSRALTTTYYNTTGKPIMAVIAASVAAGSAGLTVTINGTAVAVGLAVVGAAYGQATVIIPPNASYSASMPGGTLQVWAELR